MKKSELNNSAMVSGALEDQLFTARARLHDALYNKQKLLSGPNNDDYKAAASPYHDQNIASIVNHIQVIKKQLPADVAQRVDSFWQKYSPIITETRNAQERGIVPASKEAQALHSAAQQIKTPPAKEQSAIKKLGKTSSEDSSFEDGGYVPQSIDALLKPTYGKKKKYADGGIDDNQSDTLAYNATDMARAHRDIAAQAEKAGRPMTDKDFPAVEDLALKYAQQRTAPATSQITKFSQVPYSQRPEAAALEAQKVTQSTQQGPYASGGVFKGDKEHMAGDKVPAQVNAGEMVLNAEQQQRLKDLIKPTNVPVNHLKQGGRIDDQLADGKLALDKNAQDELMQVARGQKSPNQISNESIVQPSASIHARSGKVIPGSMGMMHAADGDFMPFLSEDEAQKQQMSDNAANAPASPVPMNMAPDAIDPNAPRMADTTGVNQFLPDMSTMPNFTPAYASANNIPQLPNQNIAPVPAADQNLVSAPMQGTDTQGNAVQGIPSALQDSQVNVQQTQSDNMAKANQALNEKYLADQQTEAAKAKASSLAAEGMLQQQMNESNAQQQSDNAIQADLVSKAQADVEDSKARMDQIFQSHPADFWGNQSTVGKIATAAALAISFPFSLITGRNPVLDFINNSVQNDLQSQQLSQNQYLAKKDYLYKLQGLAIQKQMANTNNLQAKQNGANFLAQIQQVRAQTQAQMQDIAYKQQQMNYNATIMNYKQNGVQGKLIPNANILSDEDRGRFVPVPGMNGAGTLAIDATSAANVKSGQIALTNAQNDIQTLLDIQKKVGTKVLPGSQAASQAEAAVIHLRGQLSHPFFSTVTREFESGLLNKLVVNPTDIFQFGGQTKAKLNSLNDILTNSFKSNLRSSLTNPEAYSTPADNMNEQNIARHSQFGISRADAIQNLKNQGLWQ